MFGGRKRHAELDADLKDLLEKLEVDGNGRITLSGVRYIFLPQELLIDRIFVSLLKVVGPTLKTIVWPFVERSGYIVARQLLEKGTPPEKLLDTYAEFNNPRGWGLTEALHFDIEKPEAVVRMRNGMFGRRVRESVKNVKKEFPFYTCPWGDSFIGSIRAALEKSGRPVVPLTYTEPKCEALGDEYCEWHITKKEEE
jgi:hypothetical protein